MAHITYNILQRLDGWRIACGDVIGPPYNRRHEALKDALFIADLLRKSGDEVEVNIESTTGLLPVSSSEQRH
jgi:hypothetical protein